MIDQLRERNELQQGFHFPAQPWGNYRVGLSAQFPAISAYVETLPSGLIADEI